MTANAGRLPGHDKRLLTPGPLTTSLTVKQTMLRDLGSRDREFVDCVHRVREELLAMGGLSQQQGYEAILMQGSGTFGIEAVISSVIPPQGKMAVVVNGAYGQRIAQIAERHGIEAIRLVSGENQWPDLEQLRVELSNQAGLSLIAVVHCETTSGILNPIEEIGRIAHQAGVPYFVDSMSAFGAVEFDWHKCHIDYLVSSANKCIEGVPGFSFAICRRAALLGTRGWARTVSLDLLAQWEGLAGNGQFRFTPPTHAILAFEQALTELTAEGGVPGRARRYRENHRIVQEGLRRLGFQEYVPTDRQGYIITSYCYPNHPAFDFDDFYRRLNNRGFVIYPGKVSDAACFRIGHIGRLFPSDMQSLVLAVGAVIEEMGVVMPQ